MALLIFHVGNVTVATSDWTAHEIKDQRGVDVYWGESVENSTWFSLTMDQFLARKMGDIIDLRDITASE